MSLVAVREQKHEGSRGARVGRDFMRGGGLRVAMLSLAPWLLILAVWYLVRLSGLVKPALVPTPGDVAARFWSLLTQQNFAFDIYMSTQRVVIGVALGILCAV